MMIIALLSLLLGLSYSSYRIWAILPLSSLWRGLIIFFWILPLLFMLLYVVQREAMPMWLMRIGYQVSTAWIFVLLYTVGLFLLLDLASFFLPSLKPLLSASSRGAISVGAILLAIFSYGNYRYHDKVRVPLTIELDKPLERTLKIILVSDLHLGYTIGKEEVEKWVELINSENPDLILIAGDIVDGDTRPILEEGSHLALNKLKASLGVYASLGNHEYIGGEARLGSSKHQVLGQTQIHLLVDEVMPIQDLLYIVGRDDRTNPYRRSTSELLKGLDTTRPIILLDHQPHHLEESESAGVDLQLSGHTHRGQVFPFNLIVDRMYEQSHGYLRKGKSHYYVSSGLGIWGGKFRLGTQSEYVVIELKGKTK